MAKVQRRTTALAFIGPFWRPTSSSSPTDIHEGTIMSTSGEPLQTMSLKLSKSRQWPIWPKGPQASLGNVRNAGTATQLHTPLELQVKCFKHQLYTSLPVILCPVSWQAMSLVFEEVDFSPQDPKWPAFRPSNTLPPRPNT